MARAYCKTHSLISLSFAHEETHLRKPRVLSPLRSFSVKNEVDLVPLACKDG